MDPFHDNVDGASGALGNADNNTNDQEQQQLLLDLYQPNSDATKPHYELLLSLLRKLLGSDHASVFLPELADDVIDLLRDNDVAPTSHRQMLGDLIGVSVAADTVRLINGCVGKLTDYVQSRRRQELKAREKRLREGAENDNLHHDHDDDDDDDNGALKQQKQNQDEIDPLSFLVGDDALERPVWARRGGASLLGGGGGGGGETAGDMSMAADGNMMMSSSSSIERRFHPLYMERTFLSDALTNLFPDVAPRRRREMEEEVRAMLGDASSADTILLTQLPLRINTESDPAVAAFLIDVIAKRWHVHFGLAIAEAAMGSDNNSINNDDDEAAVANKKEAVIEQIRAFSAERVAPGDAVALATRRKIRAVLKLVSQLPSDQYDDLETLSTDIDPSAAALMSSNNNNDDGANHNHQQHQDAGRKKVVHHRRGDQLNIIKFQQHHPMSRSGGGDSSNNTAGALGAGSKQQQQQLVLPPGSVRNEKENYIEVVVPMPPRPIISDKDELKISVAFPEWAQLPFTANRIEKLNAMQSKVYASVFGSDRNTLVCAPTGGGKTNVAIMSVLRALQRYGDFETDDSGDNQKQQQQGFDDDDDYGNDMNNNQQSSSRHHRPLRYAGPGTGWKVIYIAPMVALAREVTQKLAHSFESLGVVVSELSGDSALSEKEMKNIHILVATPEKWDIVSRKTLDLGAASEVKLVIFDEVHMLHSERGSVVEAIAARLLNQVERTCEPVRFVGLSATLPNYEDVAAFLRVNVAKGDLHYFHGGYRPCPLRQTFVCPPAAGGGGGGAAADGRHLSKKHHVSLNDLTFMKVNEMIDLGPIMVFVHSRKDTFATARFILDQALKNRGTATAAATTTAGGDLLQKMAAGVGDLSDSAPARQPQLAELMRHGVCVHHAGMPLEDKKLVEEMFSARRMKVLVSTATLAWGVNLPAHSVIIKGTKVYSASSGGWTDLSILDTLQMFGRAGRPGLDTSGDAVILTGDRENLSRYLRFLTVQDPVESHLLLRIMECVNAEVALGSVATLAHCVKWFRRTYFYTRMLVAPRFYGLSDADVKADPTLTEFVEDVCHTALLKLHTCELVVYESLEGTVQPTDLGRVTSFFNLSFATTYNVIKKMSSDMLESDLFAVFARCAEFASIRVRDEELEELRSWRKHCPVPIDGDERDAATKVNLLLQLAISGGKLEGHVLGSDLELIKSESSSRVTKAIHEIALIKGWAKTAALALKMHQQLLRRQWAAQTPLRQFFERGQHALPADTLRRLESSRADLLRIKLSDPKQLEEEYGFSAEIATKTWELTQAIPRLDFVHIVAVAQSRSFLKLEMALIPDFMQDDTHHGGASTQFLVTVEDGMGANILFQQTVSAKGATFDAEGNMIPAKLITIPCFVRLSDPKPAAYVARCVAVDWMGSTTLQPIDLRTLTQPDAAPPSAKPAPQPDDGEFDTVENLDDHQGLFAHLEDAGWNTAQQTAFDLLYKSSANSVVSCSLGSGREAMQSLVVAQFLKYCDMASAAVVAANKQNSNSNKSKINNNNSNNTRAHHPFFSGRLLLVTPHTDAAQRRLDFFRDAMQRCDAARKENNNNNDNNGDDGEALPPRNVAVEFLTGVPRVDMAVFFGARRDDSKGKNNNYPLQPVIVISTVARVAQLAGHHSDIFDAFDVVIFDHLHTICDMPMPAARFGDATDLARRALARRRALQQQQDGAAARNNEDDDDDDENDNNDNNKSLMNVGTVASTAASASMWNYNSGGGVRYADIVHRFVEAMQKRSKQIAAATIESENNNQHDSRFVSLCRVVGFSSTTVHAVDILGKLLKVPASSSSGSNNTALSGTNKQSSSGNKNSNILQLASLHFAQRTISLEVQSVPRHEDRLASATHHVFRLLAQKRYVASSVLVFTATARQAELMAERMMREYRGEDAIVHPLLYAANHDDDDDDDDGNKKKGAGGAWGDDKSNKKKMKTMMMMMNDDDDAAALAGDGVSPSSSSVSSLRFDDPLLRLYGPSGVALLTSGTTKHDSGIILSTARSENRKMVCFAPFSTAFRFPSGVFEHVFVASSEIASSGSSDGSGGLVDVDVPSMLQMLSRSSCTSILWCSAARRPFWGRIVQQEALPCLPLLPVSLCPTYRPLLDAYKDDQAQLNALMPHFAAEQLLDFCLSELGQHSQQQHSHNNSSNKFEEEITEEQVYRWLKKNLLFTAVRFTPFAYGVGGPSPTDTNIFFGAVIERLFARLNGLGAAKEKQVRLIAHDGQNNDDDAARDENNAATVAVLVPTIFAEYSAQWGLSAVDCKRLINFCRETSSSSSSLCFSEASMLFLACSLTPVTASVSLRPSEQRQLRALCSYYSKSQQQQQQAAGGSHKVQLLPAGFMHSDAVSTAAGKALMLVLLHVTGKLVVGSRGLLLCDGEDEDEQQQQQQPEGETVDETTEDGEQQQQQQQRRRRRKKDKMPYRDIAVSNFLTHMRDVVGVSTSAFEQQQQQRDSMMSSELSSSSSSSSSYLTLLAFPHEWLADAALALERILLVCMPAILAVAQRTRSSALLSVAVSLSRKLHSGGVPLLVAAATTTMAQSGGSLLTAAAAVAASSSSSPLMQLPGFDDPQRLELARRLQVNAPQDILSIDEEVRNELLGGLAPSTVAAIAQWCSDAPDMTVTVPVCRYDAASDVVVLRCEINSAAVVAEENEEEDGAGDAATGKQQEQRQQTRGEVLLPAVACTPRFTHLKRMCGGNTVSSSSCAAAATATTMELPVAVPTQFLITVRLVSSDSNVVRVSRVVTLERQTEFVDLSFKTLSGGGNDKKLLVEVHSLAYDVTCSCDCSV